MEYKVGDRVWIRDNWNPDYIVGHGVVVNVRFSHTFNQFIYSVKNNEEIGQYLEEYLILKEVANV
jgi:hypothetical protein